MIYQSIINHIISSMPTFCHCIICSVRLWSHCQSYIRGRCWRMTLALLYQILHIIVKVRGLAFWFPSRSNIFLEQIVLSHNRGRTFALRLKVFHLFASQIMESNVLCLKFCNISESRYDSTFSPFKWQEKTRLVEQLFWW
jgi:hypothetical protein